MALNKIDSELTLQFIQEIVLSQSVNELITISGRITDSGLNNDTQTFLNGSVCGRIAEFDKDLSMSYLNQTIISLNS